MSDLKNSENQSACVLTSGGIESAVLLNDAARRYRSVVPLYVRQTLHWEDVEIFWLKKFLRNLKQPSVAALKILDLPIRDVYENHWSVTGTRVPDAKSADSAVYLPGRNILFLSKAAIFAAMNDCTVIELGVLKGNPFADSTSSFFRKMGQVLSNGLRRTIAIHAPFAKLEKQDVILKAGRLPLEQTFSCINPKGYDHCGDCNKCLERKKAFFAAGLTDKTKYKKPGM